jgi:hypothetical protein
MNIPNTFVSVTRASNVLRPGWRGAFIRAHRLLHTIVAI